MKNDIRLFINNQEIEFSKDPQILLNYKETELHNPTVVRNSFTKQIVVEGTPRNNDIFGHIWNLERVQADNFNPIRKTDFQLFVNGELFQKGYCKLDKVTRTNNTNEYALTLYGNLGSFFYNLTYDQDDASNAKKTLASLNYSTDDQEEPDLEFTIDKDTVYEAWEHITGNGTITRPKWNVINFIPALNGIPGDFDASKILINFNDLNGAGATGFYSRKTEGDVTYSAVLNGVANPSGYAMAEATEELQEWQTRDLRSYNQRPCISMRRIINACCQPENNGGYKVELDPHFFHDENPYYWDSWVTLGMLKDLEGVQGGETFDITGATISSTSSSQLRNIYPVIYDAPLVSINNVTMSVSVRFNPSTSQSVTYLYPYHKYYSSGFTLEGSKYVKEFEHNQGVIIQLFAIGRAGEVVGQSKAYLLGGQKNYNHKNSSPMWNHFWEGKDDYGTEPEYEFIEGKFKRINGTEYAFCDTKGNFVDIDFNFAAPSDFVNLVVKVDRPEGRYFKYLFTGTQATSISDMTHPDFYTSDSYTTTGLHTKAEAMNQDRVAGGYSFVVTKMDAKATDYEGFFSGTKITKERLLSGEKTPADYLLSYCKMFGLYFYYDSTEEADDPARYPSGVVHIMDRNTFYTEEVVDLSKMIDWNKKVEIVPAMADAKWYKFDVEHVESELEEGYKEQFGKEYGAQLVNTNYNFDSNTTNLYDGNAFKSATQALEKDKYYKKSVGGLPVYQYNGLTYTLFYRSASNEEFDTLDIDFPATTTMFMESINPDYEFYDAFPKLQLHGKDNAAVDGEGVLVFFKGGVETDCDYWLTDDLPDMAMLNDGSPCWIMTRSETNGGGTTIAKKINELPYFTRDLIPFASNYGNIVHSWNFGHPQVIYSPDTYSTDGDAIYDVCWRNYMRDLYNVDTRKLNCYVRAEMDERPWPYWLRRYYWFENSIWRLNEIRDLNIGSFDTTKMEFIKVQDMDNYKLDKITYIGTNKIELDADTISCNGGTLTGRVILQAGGSWMASDVIRGEDGLGNLIYLETDEHMSPTSGRGQFITNFTVSIPANTGNTAIDWSFNVIDDRDNRYFAEFTQETCAESELSISPSTRTVSSYSGSTAYTLTAENVSNITVSCSAGWLVAVRNGNTISVLYQANPATTTRTGTITVSGVGSEGEMTATATLVQTGGNLEVVPTEIVFDYISGQTEDITITTPSNWGATISDN